MEVAGHFIHVQATVNATGVRRVIGSMGSMAKLKNRKKLYDAIDSAITWVRNRSAVGAYRFGIWLYRVT